MSRFRRSAVLVVLPAVLLVAGCGGGDAGTTTAAPTSASAEGGPGGFRDGAEFQKIRQCLTAAGIPVPTPTGTFRRPTGTPDPNRTFGGTPPSGAPGGRGGFGGLFREPQVRAALKACGITVPTGRPDRPRPTASPSA